VFCFLFLGTLVYTGRPMRVRRNAYNTEVCDVCLFVCCFKNSNVCVYCFVFCSLFLFGFLLVGDNS
jgi:hypothetical protein